MGRLSHNIGEDLKERLSNSIKNTVLLQGLPDRMRDYMLVRGRDQESYAELRRALEELIQSRKAINEYKFVT